MIIFWKPTGEILLLLMSRCTKERLWEIHFNSFKVPISRILFFPSRIIGKLWLPFRKRDITSAVLGPTFYSTICNFLEVKCLWQNSKNISSYCCIIGIFKSSHLLLYNSFIISLLTCFFLKLILEGLKDLLFRPFLSVFSLH